MKKILLDAREMEHPIPLQLSLSYLQSMGSGEFLYMVHRKNPIPLIEIAKEKKYSYLVKNHNDTWHILISKESGIDLEDLVDV